VHIRNKNEKVLKAILSIERVNFFLLFLEQHHVFISQKDVSVKLFIFWKKKLFFLNRKIKKSKPIISENKENNAYDYSTSAVSPITHDQNPTTDKIHVDIIQNSSDKLLFTYNSSEPSPRDLSSSSPPPQKVSKRSTVSNETLHVDETHAEENFF
jgi:hypothetical protein